MKHLFTSVILPVTALALISAPRARAGGEPGDPLADRPRIAIQGFFKDGKPWRRGTIETEVGLERRIVDAGKTPVEILLDAGIAPDAQALSLLEELNPDSSPDPRVEGTALIVPRLGTQPEVLRALKAGYRATLVTDADLKGELEARLERIQALQEEVRESLPPRARVPEQARRFADLAGFVADSLQQIRALVQNRTVPAEALVHMAAEAALVEECLSRLATAGATLEEDDIQTVAAVDLDFQERLDAFTPLRGRKVPSRIPLRVTVHSASGASSIGNLRVCSTPVALIHRPPPDQSPITVDRSGESLTLHLPIANYYLWAADALSDDRKSQLLLMKVRAQEGANALAAELFVP